MTEQNRRRTPSLRPFNGIEISINPLTTQFNNWIKDRTRLNKLKSVSNAIYNLFKTININEDKKLYDLIDKWLDEVYKERERVLSKGEEEAAKLFEKKKSHPFVNSYKHADVGAQSLRFNHPKTAIFMQFILRANVLIERLHIIWLTGGINDVQFSIGVKNITHDLDVGIDTIAKVLNASHREGGKYDPNIFIDKIKQYKSIDKYIASEIEQKAA